MPPPEQQLLLRVVQQRRERLGLPLDMKVTQAELNAAAQELQSLRPQRGRDPRETQPRRGAAGIPPGRVADPRMTQSQRRPETDSVEVARAQELAIPSQDMATVPSHVPTIRQASMAQPLAWGARQVLRGVERIPSFLRGIGGTTRTARGRPLPSRGGSRRPSPPPTLEEGLREGFVPPGKGTEFEAWKLPKGGEGYEDWLRQGGRDVEEAGKMVVRGEERAYSGPYPEQRDWSTGTLAHQVPSAKASYYVKDLLGSTKARKELSEYIDVGWEMGGKEWYNTEPIRNLFVGRFGDDEGHRLFVQFINLIGAASPGSDVQGNIRVGSLLRKTLEPFEGSMGRSPGEAIAAGVNEQEFNKMLNFIDLVSKGKGIDVPEGYGRVYGVRGLFKTIKSWVGGKWDDPNYVNNPKVRSFAAALLGSKTAVAIDVHAMRIMGMVSDSPAAWLGGKQAIGKEARKGLIAKYGGRRVERLIDKDGKLATRKRKKDGKLDLKEGDQRKRLSIHHFLTKKGKSWEGKTGPQEGIDFTFNASEAVKSGLVDIEDIKHMPSVYRKAPAENDYGELARLITELATAKGITPAQAQASIWLAAAGRTGVSGLSRGTFVDLVINRIFAQAQDQNLPVMAIIHDLIKNRGLISFLAGLAGAQGMLSIQGEEEKEEPVAIGAAQ